MGEDNVISSHIRKLPISGGRVAIDIVGEVIAYNSLVHSIPQNQNPTAPDDKTPRHPRVLQQSQ
jgi:hypothetical protein